MPSINKIKYNHHSVTLLLDDGTDAELPYSSLEELKLETGSELSPEELGSLREAAERFRCRNSALRFLSLRSHSRGELRTKLIKKKFTNEDIDFTLDRLARSGYIDDHDYAVRFIRNRVSRKAVGEGYLRRELFQRGIAADVIDNAMNEAGGRDIDFPRILNLAKKKVLSIKNREKRRSRLISFLKNRGFDSRVITKTLDELKSDLPPDY